MLGPTPGSAFWYGFGGDCETRNDGDPIVLYDHLADRWLVSQFTLTRHQCVAVSATPDPLGPWYRYDYTPQAGRLPDYPKLGLWSDGYGYTARLFAATFQGSFAGAFERARMLVGDPGARLVGFVLADDEYHALLPADLDGPAPPEGTPQPFVGMVDGAWELAAPYDRDSLIVWRLAVDWDDPGLSTFTEAARIDLDAAGYSFDSNLCGYARSCVPQPGTTVGLDALSDRLMYRPQLRQFAGWRSLVVSQTVDVDGTDHAGLRWYELRNAGAGWVLEQAGTYAPDANHRFMGDVAMDRDGNLMAGFSVSGPTVFPSIRIAGRLASDPPGVLEQGEAEVVTGSGSQLHSASRWGDYSSLSVDPVDDCTFWYTQEYVQTTGQAPWRTRVAAIRFPSCNAGPTGTLAGTVTAAAGSAPVTDARVSPGPGWATESGPSGAWSLDVPAGTYDVAVTHPRYAAALVAGVEVSDVPLDHWAAGHIERLAVEGVTAGCGGSRYCPDDPITARPDRGLPDQGVGGRADPAVTEDIRTGRFSGRTSAERSFSRSPRRRSSVCSYGHAAPRVSPRACRYRPQAEPRRAEPRASGSGCPSGTRSTGGSSTGPLPARQRFRR